ncbi:hypothetical protein GmHk_U060221 [Glycine max]|nr:hypothetical protein GmHk_U060221 [Glycine max]
MHIGKLITSCAYLHLKRKFHAIYIHLRDNSTPYIHTIERHKPCFLALKLRAWVSKLRIAFGHLFRILYVVPMYIKQSHNPNLTKPYSYVIEAFHRALGGRMFRHKLQENGGNVACPIASKYNIGLRPFPTTPQFKQIKHKKQPKTAPQI